jgi:two-component system sensor histidine kinase DesK
LGWVVRETVTNVLRHAHATTCRIVIEVAPGRASVSIADDGVGGDAVPAGSPASLSTGMRGLTERVRAAGGTVTVDTEQGRGRRVSAWVPLVAATDEPTLDPAHAPAEAPTDAAAGASVGSAVGGGPAAR